MSEGRLSIYCLHCCSCFPSSVSVSCFCGACCCCPCCCPCCCYCCLCNCYPCNSCGSVWCWCCCCCLCCTHCSCCCPGVVVVVVAAAAAAPCCCCCCCCCCRCFPSAATSTTTSAAAAPLLLLPSAAAHKAIAVFDPMQSPCPVRATIIIYFVHAKNWNSTLLPDATITDVSIISESDVYTLGLRFGCRSTQASCCRMTAQFYRVPGKTFEWSFFDSNSNTERLSISLTVIQMFPDFIWIVWCIAALVSLGSTSASSDASITNTEILGEWVVK